MEEREDGFSGFLLGFVIGVLGGIALGVLAAPRSGAQTRRHIGEMASDIKSSTGELLEQTREGIEHTASKIERAMGISDRNIRKRLAEIRTQLEGYAAPSESL